MLVGKMRRSKIGEKVIRDKPKSDSEKKQGSPKKAERNWGTSRMQKKCKKKKKTWGANQDGESARNES